MSRQEFKLVVEPRSGMICFALKQGRRVIISGLAHTLAEAMRSVEGQVAAMVDFVPQQLRFTEDDEMVCPKCGETNRPQLQENGYTLNHHIDSMVIKDGALVELNANGGTSEDFSQYSERDEYVLACGSERCTATFPLPGEAEIDFV